MADTIQHRTKEHIAKHSAEIEIKHNLIDYAQAEIATNRTEASFKRMEYINSLPEDIRNRTFASMDGLSQQQQANSLDFMRVLKERISNVQSHQQMQQKLTKTNLK